MLVGLGLPEDFIELPVASPGLVKPAIQFLAGNAIHRYAGFAHGSIGHKVHGIQHPAFELKFDAAARLIADPPLNLRVVSPARVGNRPQRLPLEQRRALPKIAEQGGRQRFDRGQQRVGRKGFKRVFQQRDDALGGKGMTAIVRMHHISAHLRPFELAGLQLRPQGIAIAHHGQRVMGADLGMPLLGAAAI